MLSLLYIRVLNSITSGELMARNPEPFLPLLGLGISAVSSIFKKRKRDFIEFDEDVFERDFDQVDELEM